ncbi:MAG: glycerate kinase [Planctomycetota bacterium]|nr:glycerate kinase [Planctomycetota bacterium]
MRVLVAPDKFKGTLTHVQAAAAMFMGVTLAAAVRDVPVEVELLPVADGGEGTIDLVREGAAGRAYAWVEAAEHAGLARLPLAKRDPARRSTAKLGARCVKLVRGGATRLAVALGGTATVDGGIGVAHAFGWRFLDELGRELPAVGAALGRIRAIESPASAAMTSFEVLALCDVSNPLLGPEGASRVYGPQKGATAEQVERLEEGLANLVRVCRARGLACDPDAAGAGAAGGLGFGLATFLGAKLTAGAPMVLDLLEFDAEAAEADVVMTGEGRMDLQTAQGKACAEVARRAARAGKPCIAVAGAAEGDPGALREALAARGVRFESIDVCQTARVGGPDAGARLEEAAGRAFGAFLAARGTGGG